jgi:hypothetical protein
MKKLVLIAALITTVSSMTVFGQGWVNLTGGRYTVGNMFTTPGVLTFGNTDVALYIATTAGSGAPLPEVEALSSGTPTNAVLSWSVNQAWTDILTDPNYQLATDVTLGTSAITSVTSGSHGGSFQYAHGATDNIEFNTVAGITGGANYEMYLVAWNSAYPDPTTAGLAGSLVGWSQAFSYATGASALATVVGTSEAAFGVVPEPSTIALAGLGGLTLLLFRRRK